MKMKQITIKLTSVFLTLICLFSAVLMSPNSIVKAAETNESSIKEAPVEVKGNSYSEYMEKVPTETSAEKIILSAQSVNGLELSNVEGEDCALFSKEGQTGTWSFNVTDDGIFDIAVKYIPLDGLGKSIKFSVRFDGEYPYDEMSAAELPRLWGNATEIKANALGNEYQPTQKEIRKWMTRSLYDSNGLYEKSLRVYLKPGKHTVSLECGDEPFAISQFILSGVKELPTYSQIEKEYEKNNYKPYSGDEITIQGEAATAKTKSSIALKSDSTDASLTPVDPYASKINYIGGEGWSSCNDTVFWDIDVPESGLYRLGMQMHSKKCLILPVNMQMTLTHGIMTRLLKIRLLPTMFGYP